MANEKEYRGLNNTYHTNDETYIDFSNRKKTRWLKRFFPNFVKDNLKPLSSPPIATFDGENYYHKVEGNIKQENYALTDSEKTFNAITDDNPIYPSEEYRQDRLYHIFNTGGGPMYSHIMKVYPNDNSTGRGERDMLLCKTTSYNETLSSGRCPDKDMYSNDIFARFYNVPSKDGTSYTLYYALVGED